MQELQESHFILWGCTIRYLADFLLGCFWCQAKARVTYFNNSLGLGVKTPGFYSHHWVSPQTCFSLLCCLSTHKVMVRRWLRGKSRSESTDAKPGRSPFTPVCSVHSSVKCRWLLLLEIIFATSSSEMPGRLRWFDICNMFRVSLEGECNTSARCFCSERSWVHHQESNHILSTSCWVLQKNQRTWKEGSCLQRA